MTKAAPAVELGLLSKQELEYLTECHQRDPPEFISYARELCKDSHLLWGHLFMQANIAPHMVRLEKKVRAYPRTAISMPRNSGKTYSNVILRIAHAIAYRSINETPRNATLLLKESGTEAEDKMRTILGIFEQNPYVREAFGDVPSKARIWNQQQIVLNIDAMSDHPTVYAAGLGMAVTGKHPDSIVLDDAVSVKNSLTPYMRQRAWVWWTEAIAPAAGPSCGILSNFTPYVSDDLNARLVASGDFYLIKEDALNRMPRHEDYVVLRDDPDDANLITGVKLTDIGKDLTSIWPCPDGLGCPYTPEHFREVGIHVPVEWYLLEHAKYPSSFPKSYMNVLTALDDVVMLPWSFNLWSNDPALIGRSVRSYIETICGYDLPEKELSGWFQEARIIPFPEKSSVVLSVHAWDHAISRKKGSKRTAVCFLPGTLVEGAFKGGLKVDYDGPIRDIVTASSRRLRVTPNHPIMTTKGWVLAGDLKPGDYLIRHTLDVKPPGTKDDVKYSPSPIEEVWKAFSCVRSKTLARGDLHGDEVFGEGQVQVSGSPLELPNWPEAPAFQGSSNLLLQRPNVVPIDSTRTSTLNDDRLGPLLAGVVGPGLRQAINRSPAIDPGKACRIGHVSDLDTLPKVDGECTLADATLLSQLLRTCPGLVTTDEVIHVEEYAYLGQVYDATTCHGYYWADGLLVSNCKAYRTTDNKLFLVHQAMRVGFMEACRMMLMQYKTDPIKKPISIISEGINFQASYQDFLNQTADEMLPVEDVGVQVNKAVALSESGILPIMQGGNIYWQAENVDALKEHFDFTGDGRGMSDQVDATRMAFTRIRKSLYSKPTLINIRRRGQRR